MNLFRNSFFSRAQEKLNQLAVFFQPLSHSLVFLNTTQFLGSLNDNIFKLVVAYLLIQAQGPDKASTILSTAGAVFVIPFLLFSSTAGVLADRFSKQRMIILMKAAEIAIMVLAIFAFSFKSAWASFSLLFLLASHSAVFSPSKYAIIPEIVSSEEVSRANGLITSFTYLAIILGTFLASFLTEITDRNFVLVAGCCLLIAIVGFITAFGIKKTPAQGSKKKFSFFFLTEIYSTLQFCRQKKHLLTTIFGAAFFLFVGAFTQLNIIPFAIQSLHLSAVDGGYLFLSTAFGIAFGSFLGGKISKKEVEPGLSCLAAVAMGVLFLLLDIFSTHLPTVVSCLILLGLSGGIFIVPLDSFNQINSSDEKRGQVIAAANFLSFVGVLLASFALYFFSQVLNLTSARAFGVIGVITLAVALLMTFKLSDLFLSFVARKFRRSFNIVETEQLELVEPTASQLLILQDATWPKALCLVSLFPNLIFLAPEKYPKGWQRFAPLFSTIHLISAEDSLENTIASAKPFIDKLHTVCLMIPGPLPVGADKVNRSFWGRLFKTQPQILFVRIFRSRKNYKTIASFSKDPFEDEFYSSKKFDIS